MTTLRASAPPLMRGWLAWVDHLRIRIREFLAVIKAGHLCSGVVTEVTRRGVMVTLDGFAALPLGTIGPLELSWCQDPAMEVVRRVTAEVIAIDLDEGRARLSMAATENPELWAFLKSLRCGEILSGTVTTIERFGVFVALDEGPSHPVFPGVGFITMPELSWLRFEAASDVVQVRQRVSCEFLQFDTWNGEARLSLRATQPDPFQTFAGGIVAGQTLRGQVTKLVPFGVFRSPTGSRDWSIFESSHGRPWTCRRMSSRSLSSSLKSTESDAGWPYLDDGSHATPSDS
ncbi:S1 RNA-binding domain-containing protein [Streptomyces mirabilis]